MSTIRIKPHDTPIRVVLPDGSSFLLTAYGHPDRPDRNGLLVSASTVPVRSGDDPTAMITSPSGSTAKTSSAEQVGDLATECTIVPVTGNAVVLRATR